MFELNEEQRIFVDTVRDFAQNEVKPLAAQIDEEEKIPRELIDKAAEIGLTGVIIPEEYDGVGLGDVELMLMEIELSRACASTGVFFSVHSSLAVNPIKNFGSEELKKKYLPKLATGEMIGAYALTEPNAGTDAANQQTMAVKDGDYYVLDGAKSFVTNGAEADIFIVFVRTDKEEYHKGISALVVERDTEGFTVGPKEKKLGIRGSSTTGLFLEGCRVPAENLIGKEGIGFKIAMHTLDGGRIGIASQSIGIAEAALEESVKYSKERIAFGKPIAAFQAIQFKLANMAAQIEASKLLVMKAAMARDSGGKCATESAIAKLVASRAANYCATEAVQIHGGYGYVKEYPVERLFRDARITEIYEGTTEVQQIVIAKDLLK